MTGSKIREISFNGWCMSLCHTVFQGHDQLRILHTFGSTRWIWNREGNETRPGKRRFGQCRFENR